MDAVASTEEAVRWLRNRVRGTLRSDSRAVREGDGFLAWPGEHGDATAHVEDAFRRGAAGCLVDTQVALPAGVDDKRCAGYANLKADAGKIAAAFCDYPSTQVTVIAFTGTDGKTSSSVWLSRALSALRKVAPIPSAVIGTLGMGVYPDLVPTGYTTPDGVTLQEGLARFAQRGIRVCALEASSIGIEEHRLDGTLVHTAVFTNLSPEHLDYHGDIDTYFRVKSRLFSWPGLQAAVVHVDDTYGHELARQLGAREARGAIELWTTSLGAHSWARLCATDIVHSGRTLQCQVREGGRSVALSVGLIGEYNVANLLGVIGAMRSLGVPLDAAVESCSRLSPVPGRMQCVGGHGQPLIVVDYAHTPGALGKALQALRAIAAVRKGRLWCVFGCGGNRDASKRPLMGAVAASHADCVVVTSDNPRNEAPDAIISQILLGLGGVPDLVVEPDRGLAIAQAISRASVQDVVLLAGKGHENVQEVASQRIPFSDLDEAVAALRAFHAKEAV
ncbi:UDP-N-acetylmuramoyl-L-alanyl-D-glutamate--2,6-diaminopimelate ligase [Candidatus Symbiobacter mobilis]|uniref:UDP-N-acetylmuramoyl-L-alanyl-D-glutamate--2,6-diaminopimelate ligase n=1 Tax=Candidatus Symbiobacter mobilis CR TaxID=946483 RepID=U5N6T4_9BURK|nr:UDP-N-acetylmuramoyl-L-alanyl-D-glutamate--2,6-diaminopimelate ligase [Candidatus Symbiobacter mobilis]AGX86995.1 UDP-N-acetylmuramoylalanyl-D-glutamate--2,6-diaminopimelate ligase [Candidatus Symbiobacter mobilis CR]